MKFETKKLPKSEIEITITVPAEDMKQYEKKAAEDISKEVKIKGFRPGHIPPHVLEQYVEKKYITAHAQELAIQRAYAEVVVKEKIQVVARPKIKINEENPLNFTATVATLPEVELKDYKDIKIPKKEVKVEKKEIEDVVSDMQKHFTTFKEAKRAIKKGDRVEVDFEGFDEKDKAVENTKSKNHPVIIGEGSLIPGFEEELIGLTKGEKKEFDITFPKDYHKKDFQGKKMHFKTEIKSVEEPEKPELNEELITKATGKKKSVKEFEEDIKKNIETRKNQEQQQKRENELIEKLLKKTKVELPDSLIEEETTHILEDMKSDISAKGHEWEKFLEKAKTDEDKLKEKYKVEAERRIKIRLILQYIIKEEKIKITDKQAEDELKKMKSYYPPEEDKKLDKQYKEGGLKSSIINKLALNELFDRLLG